MTTTKYTLFAIISTIVNIGMQYITNSIYNGIFSLYIALGIGTAAGLMAKYILDKKYIFYYKSENFRETGENFILYTLTGVITTIIFWGIEIIFNYVMATENAKYLGGIIGLATGYILKYWLDKRFVFKPGETL